MQLELRWIGRLGLGLVLACAACDSEEPDSEFRAAQDAAEDDDCLGAVIEDAVDEQSAAKIDAACVDCETMRVYLNALAAKISDVSLHGGDTKQLQAEYDALWVVYRRYC